MAEVRPSRGTRSVGSRPAQRARAVAMFLLGEVAGLSLNTISGYFHRHPTSVATTLYNLTHPLHPEQHELFGVAKAIRRQLAGSRRTAKT